MSAGAVQHVKSPPRADRLRFVGQADLEASLDALAVEWWRLPASQARQDYQRPTTDTMIRILAIGRTLEGAAP